MTAILEALSLQKVFYIKYLVQISDSNVRTLIDLGSEINAITPTYLTKLDLVIRSTNVTAQRINSILLKIYGIIIARFFVKNEFRIKNRYFEKAFLLANINIKVVLEILFFSFGNVDIKFAEIEELT